MSKNAQTGLYEYVFLSEDRMALSIKTTEADALARSLTRLTGESITEAVTIALHRATRNGSGGGVRRRPSLAERLAALSARLRDAYDTRPVTREEWDAASERF